MNRAKWAGFALVALLSGGCGTAHNIAPEVLPFPYVGTTDRCADATQVYGGVKRDWYALTGKQWDELYAPINLLFTPLYLADLPLSAMSDTLTLPYAIWEEVGMGYKGYATIERCQREASRPETAFKPSRLTRWFTGEKAPSGQPRELATQEDPEGARRRANPAPQPESVNPPPGNAFSSLAGNGFNSWTLSHRVDLPLGFQSEETSSQKPKVPTP